LYSTPAAFSRSTSACTCFSWRGCVVRMKSSLVCWNSFSTASNSAALRSAHTCGLTPLATALLSTFTPCSSVPVRKKVSRPRRRIARAQVSQSVVVKTWPMCGRSFT
jgi:hypothetical protein